MRIYLAAPFRKRLEIREIADKLWSAGFDIVSTWIHEATRPEGMTHQDFFFKLGLKDLNEISAADMLILDAREQSETGGKEVEFGFALGSYHRKLIVIVGEPRNPFHELADYFFKDWPECLEWLENTHGKKPELSPPVLSIDPPYNPNYSWNKKRNWWELKGAAPNGIAD
jgi:hypothetical protein